MIAGQMDLHDLDRVGLWKIRIRLFMVRLADAWSLFAKSKTGLAGVAIIILFGAMAFAHPILMNTVWSPAIFDPVIGLLLTDEFDCAWIEFAAQQLVFLRTDGMQNGWFGGHADETWRGTVVPYQEVEGRPRSGELPFLVSRASV